jgi:hypothetical protein
VLTQLIVTLIRNVLQIQVHSKNVVETYKESIQAILFINFSKGGGIFDAIIYLCQNMSTEINKRLRLVYLDIFYSIFSSIPGTFLFGSGSEGEYFKILRDKQKLDRLKRFSQLSTRHSRFGAMIQVKRSVGETSGIVSSVVFKAEDINKNQNQKIKPKPNKRFAAARDTQIYGRMIVDENAASWNEDERKLQTALTHFVLDFLENANEPLIESIFDLVRRENSGLIEKDFIHFFVMMSFGIECYCNEFEKTIAKQGIDAHYNRMAIEEKMNCKFSFIVHSIQITLIDVLYKKLVEEITKKKTEFQTKSYHAAINYFLQILNATLILSRSTYQNDAKNAQLLMQIIFSKEFSKIIKIGFLFYEPKIQYGRYVDTLVRVQDAFFTLLSVYAKNKTISLQTDKSKLF